MPRLLIAASLWARPFVLLLAFAPAAASLGAQNRAGTDSPPALQFETAAFGLGLDETGCTASLHLAGEERNWALPSTAADRRGRLAFSSVTLGGRTFDLTALTRRPGEPDLFEARFGTSGVNAVYRIKATDSAVVVELAGLSGPAPQLLRLVQLPVAIDEHVGPLINVRWNPQAAFCVMPLTGQVEATPDGRDLLNATLHAELGMVGQKVAILGMRPEQFNSTAERIEVEFNLPHPRLEGEWAKTSEDARTSCLFIDLTPDNVDDVIRIAHLGHFKYVLNYVNTWSAGRGSYSVNPKFFPGGERQMRTVIDRCHAAGLKVGMHIMTVLIGKNDALVHPHPSHGLLKDAAAALATDIDAKSGTLEATAPLDGFARDSTLHGYGGLTVQIDDELIRYQSIAADNRTLEHCRRGYNNTQPAAHRRGARIDHLAESFSSYVVDPRTDLRQKLAEEVAGVIDRCGFDMIYFDGADGLSGLPDLWYYKSQVPLAILERVRRPLRVQGGGRSPLSWHWFTLGTCDDYAALAPNTYLDDYKIARRYRDYRDSFVPAELGWWGFLTERPDYPATTPFVVEHHAVRMIALDAPITLETSLAALRQNSRSEELIGLLGRYEQLRLTRAVPESLRKSLQTGEWHLVEKDGRRAFAPFRLSESRLESGAALKISNPSAAQPLRFRMRALPLGQSFGDPSNITLLRPARPLELPPPARTAALPGAMIRQVDYVNPVDDLESVYLVRAETNRSETTTRQGLDLSQHRGLAIRIRVTGRPDSSRPVPVLNIQLESITETFRDYYLDLDFEGERTVQYWQSDFARLIREFQDVAPYYLPKRAGYGFNYASIKSLNLRWMRADPQSRQKVEILGIEALTEIDADVSHPVLRLAGGRALTLPVRLHTGESVESVGQTLRVFDASGRQREIMRVDGAWPLLPAGESALALELATPGAVLLAVEAEGEAQPF